MLFRGITVNDEIRRLTDQLARDPASPAFRRLAELLRVRGESQSALAVALRGLERHPLDAEAHAVLARICVDRGELQRAFDEWDMALRLSPRHSGALKGLGFISYRWGRLQDAERYLVEALSVSPDDHAVRAALDSVRSAKASLAGFQGADLPRDAARAPAYALASLPGNPPTHSPGNPWSAAVVAVPDTRTDTDAADFSRQPRDQAEVKAASQVARPSPDDLFRGLSPDAAMQVLLVDSDGLVVAGKLAGRDGSDRAMSIAAELSGVCDEADRAMRHLQLGDWRAITFESQQAVVSMARANQEALVVVAATSAVQLGLLKRVLEKAQRTAADWLAEAI